MFDKRSVEQCEQIIYVKPEKYFIKLKEYLMKVRLTFQIV